MADQGDTRINTVKLLCIRCTRLLENRERETHSTQRGLRRGPTDLSSLSLQHDFVSLCKGTLLDPRW